MGPPRAGLACAGRRWLRLGWSLLAGLSLLLTQGQAEELPAKRAAPALHQLTPPELEARLARDLAALTVYREGLAGVLAYVMAHPELFPATPVKSPRVLPRADREAVWTTWKALLDYLLAIDALGRYYQEFYRLSGTAGERSFLLAYGAFLAPYRHAMDFIARAEQDPSLDTLLNEPVPELGLAKDSYAALKFRFLHIGRGTEFVAMDGFYQTQGGDRATPAEDPSTAVRQGIAADRQVIWRLGRGQGPLLTAANALAVVQRAGFAAAFPVQAGVSNWMGNTKVLRQAVSLITPAQLTELLPHMQPGDILLGRHEWYLSNIGLPGFWPHAILYIGTPAERRAAFSDPATLAWVRGQGQADGDFEALLLAREPAAAAASAKPLRGDTTRVLEAISEGVVFNALEAAGEADSLVVLRPRLPAARKAQAILQAYHYAGRPYDFNFDFRTDSALVCTELVYKAYEPGPDGAGLRLPLVTMLGRPVLPANELARLFDAEYGTATQQLDFVAFLDGQEKAGKAQAATLAEFRQSWQRPKWHILVQPTQP